MRILGTEEVRLFTDENEAKEFISKLEATIDYRIIDKSSMMAGEVINAPILPSSFTTSPVVLIKKGASDGISFPRLEGGKSFVVSESFDEQMGEAMTETRLVLGSNGEDGTFDPAPLAINALPSLIAQAIGGKSSVLCQTEDKNASAQMPTEIKAAIINEFLSLRKDKAKKYTCDGMVRYIAGDKYVYLPISELVDSLEKNMKAFYPDFSFVKAEISHQYVEYLYLINDKELKEKTDDVLQMAGITENFDPALIFSTSNTGDSGANLYPILYGKGGKVLSIENPEKLEHDGSASIEKFAENVKGLEALFRTSPEKLEALAGIELKYPANAFRNVAFKSNVPVACFSGQAEIFADTYGDMATALDLYSEITNQLYFYAEKTGMNILRRTKITNSLAQKFLSPERLADCDVDFVYAEME